MQIKLFADEKPVIITDDLSPAIQKSGKEADVLFFDIDTKVTAALLVEGLQSGKSSALIYRKDVATAKDELLSGLKIIEAGGGIVQNDNKDLLFIFRRGKWDLPKGKIDKGETIEECAAREVEEETGVGDLSLKRKIGETYHIYREKGKDIVKLSHWFYFTTSGESTLAAQTEEDITEVKWIATKNIKEPMKNTYGNIKDILSVFFDTP